MPRTNHGKAQKGRGYRSEKRVEAQLETVGWRRVVGSGSLGRYDATLRGDLACWDYRLEVKRRVGGTAVMLRALDQDDADFMALDGGGRADDILIAMRIGDFRSLWQLAFDAHGFGDMARVPPSAAATGGRTPPGGDGLEEVPADGRGRRPTRPRTRRPPRV